MLVSKLTRKWLIIVFVIFFVICESNTKVNRRYGYKVGETASINSSQIYSVVRSKFDSNSNQSKVILTRYFGDRLSAPVQLLESIVTRDVGRFVNISNFLAKIGYKFGKSKHSETALTAACKISGEVGYFFVSHLLSLGAFVDTYNEYGYTPLLIACKYQHKEVIRLLIEKGKSRIDNPDSDGRTPLFYAITQLNINLVNYLLNKGANPNYRDVLGNTPLIHAVMVNFKDAIGSLLSHGAFPWLRNYSGFDPVTLTVLENRVDLLPILISSKTYFTEESNIRANTPEYHHSAARRLLIGIKRYIREPILLELLEIEIFLENILICSASDQEGLTILWWASKLHYPRFIFRLLEFYTKAVNLPEGHTCNPHKIGNNQILPLELLITHIYNLEPPFGFSFRRRFMDLLFKGKNKEALNIPNIDLMNIFVLLFMLDPHNNRTFLIQSLYLNISLESLTKIMFGIPMIYIDSNFQSVAQMTILIKNSDFMRRFYKMMRNIIYRLFKYNGSPLEKNKTKLRYVRHSENLLNEESLDEELDQDVLIFTSKIICMIYRKSNRLKIDDFNFIYHKKILNPIIYPLLVTGESKSLEESNSLSISILRGNVLIATFFTDLFSQCIEQMALPSLFKYKALCIIAYNGAIKLALKQYQPLDTSSYFQKVVVISLFTLIRSRPRSFGEILLDIDYCNQSDESIGVKFLQYIMSGFIPKIMYANNYIGTYNHVNIDNNYRQVSRRNQFIDSDLTIEHLEEKITSDSSKYDYLPFKSLKYKYNLKEDNESVVSDNGGRNTGNDTIVSRQNISPLELSTKMLLNTTCEMITSRFPEIMMYSSQEFPDLQINGWVKPSHISRTLDIILSSEARFEHLPSMFTLFVLKLLGFSPKLSTFVLRKSQLSDDTKPFYFYNIKRTYIAESILSHSLFRSSKYINFKIVAIVTITLVIGVLIIILILIISETPSSYSRSYKRIMDEIIEYSNSSESTSHSEQPTSEYPSETVTISSLQYDSEKMKLRIVSEAKTPTPTYRNINQDKIGRPRLSYFSRFWKSVLGVYYMVLIRLSTIFCLDRQISLTFIFTNNLPTKSRSFIRSAIFGIRCTFFGNDAFEAIYSKVCNFIGLEYITNTRKHSKYLFIFGSLRVLLFSFSTYWLISCGNYDILILVVYLTVFSILSNASLSLGSISSQDRDKLFHLFIPSSIDLLEKARFKSALNQINRLNFNNDFEIGQIIGFSNSDNSEGSPSTNISPDMNDGITNILDKYADSLLTPNSHLIPSNLAIHSSVHSSRTPNSNNRDAVQLPNTSFKDGFWDSKLPCHKNWAYRDVFHEYYSVWASSQFNESKNHSNTSLNTDSGNSPGSNCMTSQNPFDAINSYMIINDDGNHSKSNNSNSYNYRYFNHNSNETFNNSPKSQYNNHYNFFSGDSTPVLNSAQHCNNMNLQNISIEHHILSICQYEFIKPNECRIWYTIQWVICIFNVSLFYILSMTCNKRNLYYNFLQYSGKWRNFTQGTFKPIFFEVVTNTHLATLIWTFSNPIGFLWLILIQRFKLFLYITNSLIKRKKQRKLATSNISEILVLRELTFFITMWNYTISRNNNYLQLTLYNKHFKFIYFISMFFLMLHFLIIKDQISLIPRSQFFSTLLSLIISFGILLIIILIFIILTNLISRSISSSINSILNTYYHNKQFHFFLKREIAILSSKRHDSLLHLDY
ncbi:Ank repeat with possible signal peptide [Cryptosporidium bovis]|uniref:Ank repeat with possible signal peptide n=1 Tax=Cryptosporidium bovis TaxID=310047 RepID=UPI00351AA965|nr:Ank repeat with possible signal peptide [Cryptosporidium bovis]